MWQNGSFGVRSGPVGRWEAFGWMFLYTCGKGSARTGRESQSIMKSTINQIRRRLCMGSVGIVANCNRRRSSVRRRSVDNV